MGQTIPKPAVFDDVPRTFKRYGIPVDEFRERLRACPPPGLIAVTSMMTYWYPGVQETIAVLRTVFPGAPVVLGGVYATLCTDHARRTSGADVVLPGPGESALLRVADECLGVARAAAEDPAPSRRPAYHLYPTVHAVAMQTSSGCPFRCPYCASHLIHPEFQRRDPDQVVEEIEHYVRELGVEDIAFYDDALLVDPERHIERILDRVIDRRLAVRFHTPNGMHAERITPGLARKMHQAGFRTIRLGFETSDEVGQRDSGRKVTNPGLKQALAALFGAGFAVGDVMVYVMIGRPNQSEDEVVASIRFVHGCGARVSLSQFSPIPGTVDYERAVAHGLCPDEPLLANKSVYPLRAMGMSFDAYEGLRRIAKEGNQRLMEGASEE
jgi:radical SAM superfamily enzyme YgiQ (UPF0313 family)